MKDQRAVVADANPSSAALAAELTAAAYPVALRHAVGARWLDLELGLWRALAEKVKTWGQENGLGTAKLDLSRERQSRLS